MVKGPKAPPAPTVPTAIKSREEAQPGEGGTSYTSAVVDDPLDLQLTMYTVEYATFASGCFVSHLFPSRFLYSIPAFES